MLLANAAAAPDVALCVLSCKIVTFGLIGRDVDLRRPDGVVVVAAFISIRVEDGKLDNDEFEFMNSIELGLWLSGFDALDIGRGNIEFLGFWEDDNFRLVGLTENLLVLLLLD